MIHIEAPGVPATDAEIDALRELCLRCHVRRLDFFGSAVTDRFDVTRSDLERDLDILRSSLAGLLDPAA
jgi:hypothetical protein